MLPSFDRRIAEMNSFPFIPDHFKKNNLGASKIVQMESYSYYKCAQASQN
jgi:hypothetical protein